MGKPFILRFPIGGLDKSKGYSSQPPFSTHSSMNVWPTDWVEGRERGGARPDLVGFGGGGTGVPLNWTPVTYSTNPDGTGGVERGIVVTTTTGTFSHLLGGSWSSVLNSSSGTFASSTVYLQNLYTATGSGNVKVYDLVNGSSAPDLAAENYPGTPDPDNPGEIIPGTDGPKGAAPENCGIVASHGDRLYIAGDNGSPHVVYSSRVGNPLDWDYSSVDAGGAWANSGGSLGKISEPITSLFSHKDNECLIVGCTDSYYVIVGNPRAGGRVYSLSKVVGPLMQSALCKVGNDSTYFFSRDGLQKIREGCGEPPTPVSRKQLPSDLVGINPGNKDTVSIAYDVLHKGIHIYAKVDSERTYWFYDLQSGGFWPMDFTSPFSLCASYPAQMTQDKSGLIAIGNNAWQFVAVDAKVDDPKAIDRESYLWYGPFAMGSPHTEGILSEIAAVLSLTSGKIQYSVYTGDTAESAKNDPNPFVDTWEVKPSETNQAATGLQYKSNPIKRGTMGYLKLESVDKSAWSVEEIMCVRRKAGRRAVG